MQQTNRHRYSEVVSFVTACSGEVASVVSREQISCSEEVTLAGSGSPAIQQPSLSLTITIIVKRFDNLFDTANVYTAWLNLSVCVSLSLETCSSVTML